MKQVKFTPRKNESGIVTNYYAVTPKGVKYSVLNSKALMKTAPGFDVEVIKKHFSFWEAFLLCKNGELDITTCFRAKSKRELAERLMGADALFY